MTSTELAAVTAERDALLAREIPKDPTPDGLLYRYRNDRLFHELVDQLALSKFLPERDRLSADLDAERTARKALEEALWRANHDCCHVGHKHADHHGYDAPCPVEARIVAALALAAKLP